MNDKVIRIWNGNKVVKVVVVGDGSTADLGAPGGAGNSTKVDIEIDPWAGLIVDHSAGRSPVGYREIEL